MGQQASPVGNIMVVEDNKGIRDSLVGLLCDEGYRAIGASSGIDALRRLQEGRPALVLLDLMMPGMSGEELSAMMAEDPGLAQIPVVVITASRRSAIESGVRAAGWLQKPFDIAQLFALVEKYAGAPAAPGRDLEAAGGAQLGG